MTELYWQKYVQQIALDPMHRTDPFWRGIQESLQKKKQPKHYLQLYSMCRSDNPYIRQIKSSPNITTETVAELICRDKACELQYCQSLMVTANENRRNKIDLNGCRQQYDSMWKCINMERKNVIKREEELRNAVHGIKVEVEQKEEKKEKLETKIYI